MKTKQKCLLLQIVLDIYWKYIGQYWKILEIYWKIMEICTSTCAWKYTGNMHLEICTNTCVCITGQSIWLTMTNQHLANKFIHVLTNG